MKKLFISAILIILIGIVFVSNKWMFNGSEGPITWLDYPTNLSDGTDTIEVTHIAWACACANWLPTDYLEDPDYSTTDNSEDCIFLESEKDKLKIPDEYRLGGNNNRIRLIGRFYKDRGISRDYEKPTSQKPGNAKVFRYSKIEIIKPYTVWDFTQTEPTTKIIEKNTKAFNEK